MTAPRRATLGATLSFTVTAACAARGGGDTAVGSRWCRSWRGSRAISPAAHVGSSSSASRLASAMPPRGEGIVLRSTSSKYGWRAARLRARGRPAAGGVAEMERCSVPSRATVHEPYHSAISC